MPEVKAWVQGKGGKRRIGVKKVVGSTICRIEVPVP
jgi:hypothetical protein